MQLNILIHKIVVHILKSLLFMYIYIYIFFFFCRKKLHYGVFSMVQAKTNQHDTVDGPGSRMSEIMRFGYPGV